MNHRFYKSQLITIIDEYDLRMRINIDLLLTFYLVHHFKSSNILEIGFYQGKTFAAFVEATLPGSQLTAIDSDLQLTVFNKYYKDSKYTQDKIINLIEIPSEDFNSAEKYDFINVDGNHNYPNAFNDIMKSILLMNQTGILMIDDYKCLGVDQSINKLITMNTGFVPFMISEQTSWWHHNSHDATEFLDVILEKTISPFCSLYNNKYKSFDVKEIKCMPAITEHDDVFKLICEKYKL